MPSAKFTGNSGENGIRRRCTHAAGGQPIGPLRVAASQAWNAASRAGSAHRMGVGLTACPGRGAGIEGEAVGLMDNPFYKPGSAWRIHQPLPDASPAMPDIRYPLLTPTRFARHPVALVVGLLPQGVVATAYAQADAVQTAQEPPLVLRPSPMLQENFPAPVRRDMPTFVSGSRSTPAMPVNRVNPVSNSASSACPGGIEDRAALDEVDDELLFGKTQRRRGQGRARAAK